MPNNERVVHSRWDVTEQRWLLRNNLPHGTKLALERRSGGRKVRGDMVIHRRRLPPGAHPEMTVREVLDEFESTLITDIKARGMQVRLYGPGDRSPVNGNTKLKNVQALPPSEGTFACRPGEGEVDVAAETAGEFVETLDDACYANDVAPRAFLRALSARYGLAEVKAWLKREGGRGR